MRNEVAFVEVLAFFLLVLCGCLFLSKKTKIILTVLEIEGAPNNVDKEALVREILQVLVLILFVLKVFFVSSEEEKMANVTLKKVRLETVLYKDIRIHTRNSNLAVKKGFV